MRKSAAWSAFIKDKIGLVSRPESFIRAAYIHNTETIYLLDELGGCKIRNSKMAEDIKEKGYDDYEIRCGADEQESIVDFRDAGLPARQANVGPGSVKYTFEWLQCRNNRYRPVQNAESVQGNYRI